MPVYEYQCKKCGKNFEFTQKMSEPALTYCPDEICTENEKGEVERIISSNVGVLFKGTGFYQTDYVKKKAESPKCNCSGTNGTCNN